MSDSSPVVILLAEDNPADVYFFNEAIEDSKICAQVYVVGNGADVLRFVRREAPFSDAPRPEVIVLDLNLPVKNGKDVLADLMTEVLLRTIPVAVLTTSTSERRICSAYSPGRCLYYVKTDEFTRLKEIVKEIADYAKRLNALPVTEARPKDWPSPVSPVSQEK